VYFLGIDLAWTGKPSGLALLELRAERLHLLHLARPASHPALLEAIDQLLGPEEAAWVGLDAPVLITNPSGSRAADRMAHSLFSRQHAGAYPVHLGLPFARPVLDFVEQLRRRQFSTALPEAPRAGTRCLFEVFPHAASLRLFSLPRILPYKKGPLAQRVVALEAFRQLLATGLAKRRPALRPRSLPEPGATLAALKACEDQLDAVLCAYIAAHFWFWGLARNNILGDAQTGFIVNPSF
jgi:predicted RNase H-like nuclease